MAATDETPAPFPPIAINSFETALCVIPPTNQCQSVDQLRSLYDKGYGKWPPHINLIYPFVAPERLAQAKAQIKSKLTEGVTNSRLNVALNKPGQFMHRNNSTIYLCESDAESSSLEILRSAALQSLGQSVTPCNFHLTIGQSENQSLSSREFLLSKARLVPSLEFPIHSLAILSRERTPKTDKSASVMRLWGTIDFPTHIEAINSRISEFWIPQVRQEEVETSPESETEVEESNLSTSSSFSREVQPGTTYQYDPSTTSWVIASHEIEDSTPENISVASYNVLIDSEYPPARDRDPLLLKVILSTSGLADILVLQEVSDDFLSYLLADMHIRRHYQYTSHGPPNQPNLGPLPSLRNIVILSKWAFSWKMVPFHRRHKGAIVAEFDILSNAPPLIVAGVHLTCGLTDGSVAAKKVQLHNLKSYLTRNHPSNPWLMAGDFNIATSSYTIGNALRDKSISQQTSRSLQIMESSLAEAGFIDTWTVARIEGTENGIAESVDDLFEGEDGATFNPRENELAAGTSGTSQNRPQRYDRIILRPQGTLRVQRFDHFGLPEDHNGIQSVGSDHSGIKASLKVASSSASKHVDDAHAVQPQQPASTLTETSDLQSALSARDMFPSGVEIEQRQEALHLIKEVLLGSADEAATSTSDIPMVIVPVGSYALGTWTSASDIDCLCIGSISSKTFFKLARQRILRAEAQGVRLLRRVEANTGTMFEMSVNGINMDLQYCPAARIVERWTELPDLPNTDPVFNLSMLSLRKLKPFRDISYIQRTLPAMPTFRLAYRCIKLWAIQRGIYSSRFGYIGGIHITLMLSWVCKRLVHETGYVTAPMLVATFFNHYAEFDWKNNMMYDAFFHKQKPRYHRSAREPMVVLGYNAPNANVSHTSSAPGLNTLIKEFQMARESLSHDDTTWDTFLGEYGKLTGTAEFLKSYQSYVQITIQYWGRSLAKGKGLVSWVESRCLLQVVDINKSLPELEVRIWPARFASNDASQSDTDYQGCYLIGLSRPTDSETYSTGGEKSIAKQTLQQSLDRFLTQLQSDEKYYDPSTSWINVSLVHPGAVKDLQLDQREWGDFVPEIDPDSEDEEEADDVDDVVQATRSPPIRVVPSSTSTPQSANKLRPASDVLNRLRWDPNLDPSDYIVGYEDRFLGAKETGLERWKTEQTDDEFIPQHRILYFKRRGDGEVVWERKTRIDLVFRSGAGAGAG